MLLSRIGDRAITIVRRYFIEISWVISIGISLFAIHHTLLYAILCFLLAGYVYNWIYRGWKTRMTAPSKKTDCPICRESIDTDQFAWCTQCRYTFCTSCYDKWDDINTNCPMCRKEYGVVKKVSWFITSYTHMIQCILFIGCLFCALPCIFMCVLPIAYFFVILFMKQ